MSENTSTPRPQIQLSLSEKQYLAFQLLDDPQVVELDYGGSAGGAKSFTVAIWMAKQCREYPGIRIGLGRKEMVRLKQTSVVTLLREVHPILGINQNDYEYSSGLNKITYINGSEIQLFDLNYQPSDPDYDTLGSLNLTHVVIEEIGEIRKKAYDVFGSRKDRFLNQSYGITGKLVTTQNPSRNFTREMFYDPYANLGGGEYQKWPIGNVYVRGEKKEAFRAFVKSLPIDNPFLSENYIETLKRLPTAERKRLYLGDWDYADTDDMMFSTLLIDRSTASELDPTEEFDKYIGVDVSDKGKDKTIVSLIDHGILVAQRILNVDTTGEKPISELYSLELIKFAQQNGFTPQKARQIAIEGNGVGVGMRDTLRMKGWMIYEYTATSKSRSKGFYDLSLDMDAGDIKIYRQLETKNELVRQLQTHTYEMNDKLEPVVLSKKKIKEVIGKSPDEADSFMIANYIRRLKNNDPKNDPSRIIF